jgi:hypothetical protein
MSDNLLHGDLLSGIELSLIVSGGLVVRVIW